MRPLVAMPLAARAAMRGVLADIDDTLSTRGRITAQAYAAMESLRAAGLLLIPITGRPAGWCDHIARMWPVDAVVGENGAFWFRHDSKAGKLVKRYVVSDMERGRRAEQLLKIGRKILAEVPGSAIASDQPYREADLAIDFREDVPELPREAVAKIVSIMEGEGLTAKVSSIHVNGWFGGYDKLSTTRQMMKEDFDIDLDRDREMFVFAGDSPNDQPMFAYFPNAVGVANVLQMADLMSDFPKWITPSAGAAGFAELADALIPTK
jgi:HAD superfamily hydrolase (TIGR01484 family)